jgi:hypothetical protein
LSGLVPGLQDQKGTTMSNHTTRIPISHATVPFVLVVIALVMVLVHG